MKNRELTLGQCNVLKVVMMITVIFYHAICLWGKGTWFVEPAQKSSILSFIVSLLNSVHIYVFAFVSGFLFYFLKYEKQKYNAPLKDISGRAKRLLIPYVLVAFLWVIPFNSYFFGFDFLKLFKEFVLGVSPSQLWFLLMLFVVFCLFYFLADFFKKQNFFIGAIVCVAFYGIGVIGNAFLPNIFQIWTAFRYVFFYWLGFYFRKERQNLFYKIPFFVYLLLFLALFTGNYCFVSGKEGILFKLLSIALPPVISVFGVLSVVVGVASINTEKLEKTKSFQFLVKHNFVMYLFHQQLIYIAITLLNGVAPIWVMVIVNLLFALGGSILIAVLLSKIPKIKWAFGYKN